MKLSTIYRSVISTAVVVSAFSFGMAQANDAGTEYNRSGQGTDVERVDTHDDRDMRSTDTETYDGEPVEVEDFVETAMAKGIAELETSKLAVEKGSQRVQEFANRMIEDHSKANSKLADIAAEKNLNGADDASLMDKAKTMILEVREGESFDEAYINNQIAAHEQSIALFKRAAKSDSAEIRQFAEQTLPKLEEHLKMATDLKHDMSKEQANRQ